MNSNYFTMAMLVFSFLLSSCRKTEIDNNSVLHDYRVEDVLYAKDSRLKRVYQCSDNSRVLHAEYRYDDLGRISRIDYAKYSEIYLYNVKGQLDKIENSSVLTSYVLFSYNAEGNKIKEQVMSDNEPGWLYRSYEYANGKLTKQEIVVNGQSPQYIHYEYKGDKLVKTKSYFLGKCDITEMFYAQNLLIYSITYDEDTKSGFIKSDVKYYYDRSDNLIKTIIDDRMRGARSYHIPGVDFDSWEYEYE